MICFPISKINLGLHVISKREDGFHTIESVFYPVKMRDILEITQFSKNDKPETSGYSFSSSGLKISGPMESNLVLKAWKALQKEFSLPGIHIHLHKVIPMGAGLGGGSSDAASLIVMVNTLFGLALDVKKMCDIAEKIGSDCPFFVESKPKLVRGKGEILDPFEFDLSQYRIELEFPGIHIDTKEAYQGVTPCSDRESLVNILNQPLSQWKNSLSNDFEDSILPKYPEIQRIKENFYRKGALYSSMTGSGSAVYGIFNKE